MLLWYKPTLPAFLRKINGGNMKLLSLFLAIGIFAGSAMAHHHPVRPGHPPPHHRDHDRSDDLAFLATLTGFTAITLSLQSAHHRHSLMVEAAPLAADYLSTGTGLENQALVAAMLVIRETESSLSNDELALRVIEEANQ